MPLSDKLKRIRKYRNLTQKELAEISEVTRESIGNYERGDRTPPADILKKIALALNVSVDALTSDDSFSSEVYSRAMQIAFKLASNSDEILRLLGNYADYNTLVAFNGESISRLPISSIKGLLRFIAANSLVEFNKIYEDLIKTDIYNLDSEFEDYCQQMYTKLNNPLNYINSDNKKFLESQGYIKDGHLSVDAIKLDKSNQKIKGVQIGNQITFLPESFDEIKNSVDKAFPILNAEVNFLSNPKLEMVFGYSYNDLAVAGYDNLLIMAIEKVIETTLSDIKEHEKNGDLFDGVSSWISKESPVYEILKETRKKNSDAINTLKKDSEDNN
ncbi:helix-turn-helix domain-containing protein [Clostridium diolis]|uniref:HTH cro/C1-type domain-containing protein n=1 Tax=Clostridium diolis TaxID=223919 RepID=A0AAV3W6J0_9CLOT|nr:helix-turn-helix domain-containing protein [Clostridium diolis]QES71600.1 helix-turn-helix domain-containing protein [Clostridium diolis]GEA33601.1 hypothetical protein CDIOL_45240 [Clostridium diolis]